MYTLLNHNLIPEKGGVPADGRYRQGEQVNRPLVYSQSSTTTLARMAAVTRETIQIPSAETGVNLDVWLYTPEGKGPFPVVVAGHG